MSFSRAGWSINRFGRFTPSGIAAARVSVRDGKDYTAKAINPAETNANVQRGRAWQGPCHEWNRLCKIIFLGDMAHSHEGAISFIMSAMVHQPKPRAATCQAVTTGDNNKKRVTRKSGPHLTSSSSHEAARAVTVLRPFLRVAFSSLPFSLTPPFSLSSSCVLLSPSSRSPRVPPFSLGVSSWQQHLPPAAA